MFWYAALHHGWGGAVASFAAGPLLWLHFSGGRWVRWDRAVAMLTCGGVTGTLVFGGFLAYFSTLPRGAITPALRAAYLGLAFFSQALPSLVSALISKPLLQGTMRFPIAFSVGTTLINIICGYVLLVVVIPAFAVAGEVGRITLRILALPLLNEVCSGAIRVLGYTWLSPSLPADWVLVPSSTLVLFMAMAGRFLSTNMHTVSGTIAVSLLLAVVELGMRGTMPWRDAAYTRLLCHPAFCRPPAATHRARRAHLKAWTGFMQLETVAEDVGILFSLAIALLLRVPPTPGAAPLTVSEVALRVAVQYAIELLTDIGFALAHYTLVTCCGVRYGRVTAPQLQAALAPRPPKKRVGALVPKLVAGPVLHSPPPRQVTLRSASDSIDAPPLLDDSAAQLTSEPSVSHSAVAVRPDRAATLSTTPLPPIWRGRMRAGSSFSAYSPSPTPPLGSALSEPCALKPSPSPGGKGSSGGAHTPRDVEHDAPSTPPPPTSETPEPEPCCGSWAGFWSCPAVPCVFSPDSPEVQAARRRIAALAHAEMQQEMEAVWEPVSFTELLALSKARNSTAAPSSSRRPEQPREASPPPLAPQHVTALPIPGRHMPDGRYLVAPTAVRGRRQVVAPSDPSPRPPTQPFDRALLVLAVHAELMAVRILRAWETRHFFWLPVIAVAALGGGLFISRAYLGTNQCVFGDPHDASTWMYDVCTPQ